MKNMYKKGQAATEFLMTYGWAILAIVIVAAVLWNMGIFKGSCTTTAPVQVFPAGSQLAVKDWRVLAANNSLEMVVQNLAGSDLTVNTLGSSFTVGGETAGALAAAVDISSGSTGTVTFPSGGAAHTVGDCFTNGVPTLSYTVTGGTNHSLVGTLQGKYE